MDSKKEKTMGRGLVSMALAGLLALAAFAPSEAMAYDAGATVHEVGTVGELYDAFVEINANGGDHVIILQSDITLSNRLWASKSSKLSGVAGGLTKGNTVLLGEGHTITADIQAARGLMVIDSATLSLGEAGYTKTLTICAAGTNSTKKLTDPLIGLEGDAVLNMYDNVTLSDSNPAGTSGGVMVYENTVFNMYGGTLTRLWSANCGGAVTVTDYGVFNMYGGEISECRNRITSATYYFNGAGGGGGRCGYRFRNDEHERGDHSELLGGSGQRRGHRRVQSVPDRQLELGGRHEPDRQPDGRNDHGMHGQDVWRCGLRFLLRRGDAERRCRRCHP